VTRHEGRAPFRDPEEEEEEMEGNPCYKFSTIANFVAAAKAKDIRVIVEAGANVGDMTLMMHHYFPAARIIAFEPVKEYFDVAASRTALIANIAVHNKALTSQHRFFDHLGKRRRRKRAGLVILKGLPESGPGWAGGSVVLAVDDARVVGTADCAGYAKLSQVVTAVTLDEIVAQQELAEIDILKLDCEGCEHFVLGTASRRLMQRIRFIVGEYHGIARFFEVMREKLFLTHKINLVGERDLGCFFAERLDGTNDGILRYDKSGMLVPRSWLSDTPIEWHLFDERHVAPSDRLWHGLP
jgi:FkbM family methyltransferase